MFVIFKKKKKKLAFTLGFLQVSLANILGHLEEN